MPFGNIAILTLFGVITSFQLLYAEQGILVLYVTDLRDKPLPGVVLTTKGLGSSSFPTERLGKTRVRLAGDEQEGESVSLQIVKVLNSEEEWIFVSPWKGRAIIPSFKNKSDNFVTVVLARKCDEKILTEPIFRANLVAETVQILFLVMSEEISIEAYRFELRRLAKDFCFSDKDVAKTFIDIQKSTITATSEAVGFKHPSVATLRHGLALTYHAVRDYKKAERSYKQVLKIRTGIPKLDKCIIAKTLENYAVLLRETNRKTEAEQKEEHARTIRTNNCPLTTHK